MIDSSSVLDVSGLSVSYSAPSEPATPVVDGVTFSLHAGEIFGLVGESGCGKSTVSLAIMGLLPKPYGRIVAGSVMLQGKELVGLSRRELAQFQGSTMSMVFQEPMTSLNPAFTIGDQLAEPLRIHRKQSAREAKRRAVELLDLVGITRPAEMMDQFPHQLSGGMRQRVMIAMALSCEPRVIIADEPTTALDVTIQAQVLELLRDLCDRTGTAVLLITHDLGVIAETCDSVGVMYAGQIVEHAATNEVFAHPRHPYTRGLLRATPNVSGARVRRLPTIPGTVPAPGTVPGCQFSTRCTFYDQGACAIPRIPLLHVGESDVRCVRQEVTA
jgi:peptide/nickel transport system ATP-binding protein